MTASAAAIQVVGQPGRPVVFTSLDDKTVGAGFELDGSPQTDTSNDGLPERTAPVGTFRIDMQLGAALAANADAVRSLEQAAAFWEAILEDPITLVFDADFGVTVDPIAIGEAQAEYVTVGYERVRDLLIDDARSHETIVSQLPQFADLNATLPVDPRNPYSVSSTMEITRPNALALGMDPASLPGVPSAVDPNLNRDGVITFANALNQPGADLFFVAVHEIGHLLGFVSAVDDVEGGRRLVALNTLDLFRLAPAPARSTSPRARGSSIPRWIRSFTTAAGSTRWVFPC